MEEDLQRPQTLQGEAVYGSERMGNSWDIPIHAELPVNEMLGTQGKHRVSFKNYYGGVQQITPGNKMVDIEK